MNDVNTPPAPDKNGTSAFYVSAEKIYPREVQGMFTRLRRSAVVVLLGLFYVVPWFRWDGQQAVLFDLPARKFHIFGLHLWPQDFIYLALLLIVAALSLFFVTALAGRLWCGYACPQTVWTELFVWIEQWTEGSSRKRRKLDKGPWTGEKLARKGLKQFLWVLLAFATGFTFVGYFTPIIELGTKLVTVQLGPWEMWWIGLYGLATYGNAGFLREQVCKYMCPYARFQSAMFDKDTLIISYDDTRGDPRGGRRRGADPKSEGLGDCIDCGLCVQVCPTGIDIRDGLQYECIACAACIDVCDSVMDKMDYPRGLVRYTTEHAVHAESTRVLRPRVAVYAVILLAVCAGLVYSLSQRVPLRLDIMRDRNQLYREVAGGLVENSYTIKILNMDDREHRFDLSLQGLEGGIIVSPSNPVSVAAGEILALPARIQAPGAGVSGGHAIVLALEALDEDGPSVETDTRFLAPVPH